MPEDKRLAYRAYAVVISYWINFIKAMPKMKAHRISTSATQ